MKEPQVAAGRRALPVAAGGEPWLSKRPHFILVDKCRSAAAYNTARRRCSLGFLHPSTRPTQRAFLLTFFSFLLRYPEPPLLHPASAQRSLEHPPHLVH